MAAPLKGPVQTLLSSNIRLNICTVRCMSSIRKHDGPPPWAARQVPQGKTSYAMQLTRIQSRDVWKKRNQKVNKPWKQMLLDYNQRKIQMKNQPPPPPPKLLMIRLVKGTGTRPYWEKEAVRDLGLSMKKMFRPVIVKNKESNANLLREVKHLIEIMPLTFPYGLPESEEDFEHCYIRDNGEFVVTKRLKSVDESEEVKTLTEQPESVWDIKQELIDKTLERKKMLYQINQEYYPTKYVYKRNEDGKEYRYKGDQDVGSDKIWY